MPFNYVAQKQRSRYDSVSIDLALYMSMMPMWQNDEKLIVRFTRRVHADRQPEL
jgi:hypothetical protein